MAIRESQTLMPEERKGTSYLSESMFVSTEISGLAIEHPDDVDSIVKKAEEYSSSLLWY